MAGTLGITGHRPAKLGGHRPNPIAEGVKKRLREEIEKAAPDLILSGMAIGVDQWAAQIACELGIAWYACVPYSNQDEFWRPDMQRVYRTLLKQASMVVIVSSGTYSAAKMYARNAYMVDNSHSMLAVWDGERKGGTYQTLKYAESVGRPFVRIDPTQFDL